jgi:hypothetical protein
VGYECRESEECIKSWDKLRTCRSAQCECAGDGYTENLMNGRKCEYRYTSRYVCMGGDVSGVLF